MLLVVDGLVAKEDKLVPQHRCLDDVADSVGDRPAQIHAADFGSDRRLQRPNVEVDRFDLWAQLMCSVCHLDLAFMKNL
jgi:hypothetical protein